jgi:hypothetical protein
MTEEEGDRYIALALLHGPSTVGDIRGPSRGSHEPLHRASTNRWWVYRDAICQPYFNTRAEAARHYCKHYGIEP